MPPGHCTLIIYFLFLLRLCYVFNSHICDKFTSMIWLNINLHMQKDFPLLLKMMSICQHTPFVMFVDPLSEKWDQCI